MAGIKWYNTSINGYYNFEIRDMCLLKTGGRVH